MIKFSIVIPVYNVENYLKECIESVIAQTFRTYEIILVDDGSTDNSGLICDEWNKKDGRIKVIHQTNQGLSMARNHGIDVAQGEYIIFLDSDDLWHDKEVLESINNRLELSQVDVLSFDFAKFTDSIHQPSYFQGKKSMPMDTEKKHSLQYMIDENIWIACAWNKAIKRTLFNEGTLYFEKGITSEDIDWCMRVALKANSFDYLDKIVVCYRQRNNSISKAMTLKKVYTLLDNIDKCMYLLQSSENENRNLLKSYIGYQYGTLLYSVAMLHNKEDIISLLVIVKKMKYILTWSNNKKIKMLRIMSNILGIKGTIGILKIYNKVR